MIGIVALVTVMMVLFYHLMPRKLHRAITATLIFAFYVELFVAEYLYRQMPHLQDGVMFLLFFMTLAVAASFTFAITYLVKDEEKQRKIFFWTIIAMMAGVYSFFTIDMINGFKNNYAATYLAHICSIVGYGFGIVYFGPKFLRKHLLGVFCCFAITGGAAVLIIPGNAMVHPITDFCEFEFVLFHALMIWAAVAALRTDKVAIPYLRQILWGGVLLAVSAAFAYLMNFINYKQMGDWGNEMFLTDPVRPWFPTWAFYLVCYAVGALIALALNYRYIATFIRTLIKKEKGDLHGKCDKS